MDLAELTPSQAGSGTNDPDPHPGPVVLFDGLCNLCNGAVRFVIRRDPRGVFRFASLDSAAARELLGSRLAPKSGEPPDSMFLVEGGVRGRVANQSTAVLRIARRLRWPWPVAYGFIAVPRPVRDWVYAFIARNRYRWFGRRDRCEVPTPELRDRFLG